MLTSNVNPQITEEYLTVIPEWPFFDRKSRWIRPTDLANTIIWMANASGWLIAVWIKNKEIEEFPSDMENHIYNDFLQVAHNFISPVPRVKIEELEEWTRKVLLFFVDISENQVYKRSDNDAHYLRVWDETKKLDTELIQELYYDKWIHSYELWICEDFDESDLNIVLLQKYAEKLQYEWDFRELLVARNLAKRWDNWKYKYTNAAILLFANDPDKYIPSARVRYLRYEWDKLTSWESFNIRKDKHFFWPIPSLIEQLKHYLNETFLDYYSLDIKKWTFWSFKEYPEDAWLEWIINALVHRSYNKQGNPIMIKHYDNRLEICNSWPLPSLVTVDNIKYTRFSRNPKIAFVLYDFWYVRETNEWVERIYKSMESVLSTPKYENRAWTVTLILENPIRNTSAKLWKQTIDRLAWIYSELWENEKKIITYLLINETAKTWDLINYMWVAKTTIINTINKLDSKHLIVRIQKSSTDPNSYIEIKKI